jgi:hypothetical protein
MACLFPIIKSFLIKLRRELKAENWQVAQASDALRILYQNYFNMMWAQDWQKVTYVSEDVGRKGAISFRDEGRSKEVDIVHKDVFNRFRSEMRRRHYSLRTGKSYEDWIRRFLIFHDLKMPLELGADSVKAYLEYLAEKRQVTASTQNQALL